eukprot:618783-Rhodomonas_salina.6
MRFSCTRSVSGGDYAVPGKPDSDVPYSNKIFQYHVRARLCACCVVVLRQRIVRLAQYYLGNPAWYQGRKRFCKPGMTPDIAVPTGAGE